MTDVLAAELLAFSEALADESRAMLQQAARAALSVDIKADNSFVTVSDRAVETRLRERIEAAYPHHGVLGEEHGSRDLDAEFVWVIDPIDGTAAFIAGIPVYGTLIGLARAGLPWLGVIDHPVTSERLTGVAGRLARHNGSPIRCRPNAALDGAFMTSSNPRFLTDAELAATRRLDRSVRFTQYGGSCYAYGCLARGRTDLAVDGGLDTFDVFAPVAIVQGAGGTATDWDGAPISLAWRGQLLAAGDGALHAEAMARLHACS